MPAPDSFVARAAMFVLIVAALCGFVSATWRARRRSCLGAPTPIGSPPVGVF
jgi:hypothetical protein